MERGATDQIRASWRRVGRFVWGATDLLLPAELRNDEDEASRRGRLAIGASLIIMLSGLLTAALLILQGPIENLSVALGVVVLAALVPVILRHQGVGLAGHCLSALVFGGLGLAALRGGGQIALPYILLPVVPILASLIVGLRAGLLWAGLSALGLAALNLAMRSGLEPVVQVDARLIQASLFRGSLVMLPFLMLMLWAYESARTRALTAAREARREAEERGIALVRATRELADFTYVAAHDLKEPLRGLHSCAGFLIEDCGDELGVESRERLHNLRRLALRMDTLIDALRRMAEIKREALVKGTVSIQEVVEEALENLAGIIQEKRASIRLEGPFPAIRCDRGLLRTVIENLVENAIHFNDSADVMVSIGILDSEVTVREPEKPVLYVRDNGLGIPEGRQEDVFRIFKRIHGNGQGKSRVGVGMALVKKIVELHGGEVCVESVPGEGTAVFFSIGTKID